MLGKWWLILFLPVLLLTSCTPLTSVDNATKAYLKDEGLGASGYVYRNPERTVRVKIGEISKDLLYSASERNRVGRVTDPDRWWEEDLRDSGMVFGVLVEVEF